LLELVEGMRAGAGIETPPLAPRSGGAVRSRELVAGIGSREL
jgi:UDP-glucose 4-epimerase